MKGLRLVPDASLPSVMLATSALADEIPLPGLASAVPTRAAIEMPGAGVAATDLVTEIALNLVKSVLSLFFLYSKLPCSTHAPLSLCMSDENIQHLKG